MLTGAYYLGMTVLLRHMTVVVVRHAPIYGFCRPLEGDCGVADARQETTLPSIGALH
jgi:hypothetical protein